MLGLLGTAEGVKGAYEGLVYTRVLLPGMQDLLEGVDSEGELATWRQFIEAIDLDDPTTATQLSQELVARNCAYQAALGIAECTATADE